jgi:hypothetical protein
MGGKRTGAKRRTLPRRYVSGMLDRLDRAMPEVRAVIQGAQQIIEDKGGEEHASFLEQRAAYRTMHMDMLCARDELKLAQGQEVDEDRYRSNAETWRRYALMLGLPRVVRSVTFRDRLAQRAAAASPAASGDQGEVATPVEGEASAAPAPPESPADAQGSSPEQDEAPPLSNSKVVP